MIRHHDQGNSLGVYSFRGLESKTITMGSMATGRQAGAGALAGSLHLDPQIGGREKDIGNSLGF